MFSGSSFRLAFVPAVFVAVVPAAVLTGFSGLALGQAAPSSTASKTPDAQVEASVLKALAGAPDIANQPITTTTVYGVVTLSGSVDTEAQRTQAESIAARTPGVQKVVDELTLGSEGRTDAPAGSQLPANAPQATPSGPSSGNVASGQAPQAPVDASGPAPSSPPSYGPSAPEYGQPMGGPQGSQPQGEYPQPAYPQANRGSGPAPQYRGYPQGGRGYPAPGNEEYGGQQAGETVTIAPGALLRIRINETLDSGRTQPGTTFDGVVVNDVVAGGAVAIPRGAQVQGTVVEAKRSGVLAGRGEMSLQLTQVSLGGRTYPLTSDVWAQHGGDKTIQSVNSTAVGSGMGAIFGAVAGGGVGAAIGAGVGGALGLGSSAASGSGQVYIPSEGMLTFHLAQPVTVATVSQAEMNRLAQGAGPHAEPPQMRRRYYAYPPPYPYPYYGPVYYRPYFPYRY